MKHLPQPTVAVLFGTRPEIIKLAPVVAALEGTAILIHSGQHYDDRMSTDFFAELGLPSPRRHLTGVGGQDRGTQIGTMVTSLTEYFALLRPDALVVQGDTNTVVAGALAANIVGVPVVHVEAGLRSRDRDMPEEINRMLTGVLADLHCAPTAGARDNLLREGVDPKTVHVTGNSVIESCERALARLDSALHPAAIGLGPYILATIHRPENTDDEIALARVLSALAHAELPVVFVAHPRTVAAAQRFGLDYYLGRLTTIPAVGYEGFLRLARDAAFVVSDSGGVQEEVTVLRKPLLLVRRNTERPEAVASGFVHLVTPEQSLTAAIDAARRDDEWAERLRHTSSPFGDATASRRIARLTLDLTAAGRGAARR